MHHIRLIDSSSGGGGGRFFAGGDIRLKPHHHDLKCPRCDSLNTKFCYYNNYNLSQPRHFCKSCRRYWTKGGVLRNVPVGGGVRKSERSGKPKSKTRIPPSDSVPVDRKTSNSGNSSSESSRTTENTTATATARSMTTTENTTETLLNFNEPSTRFFNFTQSSTPLITTFDSKKLNQSNMSPEIGTFTNVITSSTDQLPSEFNTTAGGVPSFQLHHQNPIQWTEMRSSTSMEQTAEIDCTGLGSRGGNCGLAGKDDWQNTDCVDEGLFDLTGTVDQTYWSQSQWNDDHLHHLNFLP